MRNLHEINKVEIPDEHKWVYIWFNLIMPGIYETRWSILRQRVCYRPVDGNWQIAHNIGDFRSSTQGIKSLSDFDPSWVIAEEVR